MKKFLFPVLFGLLITGETFADYRKVLSDIEARIESEKQISGYELEMDYHHGAITLSGRVGTEENRTRIANLASTTKGVKSVINKLEVDPELAPRIEIVTTAPRVISDRELSQKVFETLKRSFNGKLPAIDIEVNRGVVRFSGSTGNFRTIDRILSITLMVDGVKDIESQMTINGAPYRTSIKG